MPAVAGGRMTSSFGWLRGGLNEVQRRMNRGAGAQDEGAIARPREVTSGLGGIGQIRGIGRPQASVEVPQERAIPGLPSPQESSGGYGPPRIGGPKIQDPYDGPEAPRVQRNEPMLYAGREVLTREGGVTPSGVVLPGEDNIKVSREVGSLASSQLKQQYEGPKAPTERGRWSSRQIDSEWTAPQAQEPTARQMRGMSRDLTNRRANIGQVIENQGGEELLQQLTSREVGGDRPFEGTLVSAGQGRRGDRAYLDNGYRSDDGDGTGASRNLRGDLRGGDPSEGEGGFIEGRFTGGRNGARTWTDSAEQNIRTTLKIPYIDEKGFRSERTIDPSQVVETLDSGSVQRKFGQPSGGVIRLSDNQTIDTDSTFTPNTRAERTAGDVVKELRDEYKTPTIRRDVLLQQIRDGRGRIASEQEQNGTLVAFLKDEKGNEIGVYDPERGKRGVPLTYNREVPKGNYDVQNEETKLLRVGNPLNRDYDGIRDALRAPSKPGYRPDRDANREDLVKSELFPGMGEAAIQKTQRVYPATLDNWAENGAQFLVKDPQGELRAANSWQNALQTARNGGEGVAEVLIQRREGQAPTRLMAVPDQDGGISLLLGAGDETRAYGPAHLSPDRYVRKAIENEKHSERRVYGRNQELEDVEPQGYTQEQWLKDIITSGGSDALDMGTATGPSMIAEVIRRQAAAKGVHPSVIEDALLRSARTNTQWDETLQAMRQRTGGKEVNLFNESDPQNAEDLAIRRAMAAEADTLPHDVDPVALEQIAPSGSYQRQVLDAILTQRSGEIPYASASPDRNIAAWENGRERGVDPRAVDRFNSWVSDGPNADDWDAWDASRNPDIAQALSDEDLMRMEMEQREATPGSYEAQQAAYDAPDYSAAGRDGRNSGEIRTVSNALIPGVNIDPARIGEIAHDYAYSITGGRDPALAAKLAQVALNNTRGPRDGAAPHPQDVLKNIEIAANFDPDLINYALQFQGDGDFKRAADLVDVAKRGAGPLQSAEPVSPIDVFDGVQQSVGNDVSVMASPGGSAYSATGVEPSAGNLSALDEIERLAGKYVGVGSESFSKGKQIAADKVRAKYQATAPGMREFDYQRYANLIGNDADPNQEAAMNFMAERLRRLREAGVR